MGGSFPLLLALGCRHDGVTVGVLLASAGPTVGPDAAAVRRLGMTAAGAALQGVLGVDQPGPASGILSSDAPRLCQSAQRGPLQRPDEIGLGRHVGAWSLLLLAGQADPVGQPQPLQCDHVSGRDDAACGLVCPVVGPRGDLAPLAVDVGAQGLPCARAAPFRCLLELQSGGPLGRLASPRGRGQQPAVGGCRGHGHSAADHTDHSRPAGGRLPVGGDVAEHQACAPRIAGSGPVVGGPQRHRRSTACLEPAQLPHRGPHQSEPADALQVRDPCRGVGPPADRLVPPHGAVATGRLDPRLGGRLAPLDAPVKPWNASSTPRSAPRSGCSLNAKMSRTSRNPVSWVRSNNPIVGQRRRRDAPAAQRCAVHGPPPAADLAARPAPRPASTRTSRTASPSRPCRPRTTHQGRVEEASPPNKSSPDPVNSGSRTHLSNHAARPPRFHNASSFPSPNRRSDAVQRAVSLRVRHMVMVSVQRPAALVRTARGGKRRCGGGVT